MASAPASAQWLSVSITPQFASYPVGTPVAVTIEVCAYEGMFSYHYETVYFNGVDVTSEFQYTGWPSTQCQISWGTDGFTLSGWSYTTVNGPNDIRFVYTTSIESGDITVPNYATYAAAVTPDGQSASDNPHATGLSRVFAVQNPGSSANVYAIMCGSTGQVTCTGTSPGSVSLAGYGASTSVTAYYNTSSGGSGTLKLTASGSGGISDSGSFNIAVLGPNVTPDAEAALVPFVLAPSSPSEIHKSAGPFTQIFTVTNPDPVAAHTYSLAVGCSALLIVSCSVSSPITLTANQSKAIGVTYAFIDPTSGSSGRITLTATDQAQSVLKDSGFVDITAGPSGIALDRGHCLSMLAGASAAYECGDLRLTHPLPAVRSLNTDRVLVLLYNTQHARPFPLLQIVVTAPNPLPDSVRAIARVGGATMAQRSWPGSAWGSAGQVRRVAVGFLMDSVTGIYNYELEVQRQNNGAGPVTLLTSVGQIPILNRKASPFGPGWWLAGFERLYFPPGLPSSQVMWVGGDGSVRRYDRWATVGSDTAYLAMPLDHPDTLFHKSNGDWVRILPGGVTVTFNGTGVHRFTTSRTGHFTEFVDSMFADTVRRLVRIKVPPADSGLTYTFAYGGSPLRLQSVTVPDAAAAPNRVTSLTWVGDTLRILNPGSTLYVKYKYEGGGTNRIIERHSERGAKHVFEFDAGSRLTRSRLAVGSDSINRSFCAAEVRSLATCSPTPVLPDSAYTRFDGPRTDSADVVAFWVNRWGAPTKTRDPFNYITTLSGDDARWPLLVTRVRSANGRIVGATYDQRGNIATSADSSVQLSSSPLTYATTRYEWDQKWDEVTKVTMPTGEFTRFGYDPSNGNRVWMEDRRGAPSRVSFEYYTTGAALGLVKVVTDALQARDSLWYDVRGNLSRVRLPSGDTTGYLADRPGRIISVRTKVGTVYRRDSTWYNSRGLVAGTMAIGPSVYGLPARNLVEEYTYTPDGLLDTLKRFNSPDISPAVGTLKTVWRYDLVGRVIAQISPDGYVDSTRYDAAGNAIVQRTRRGHSITMVYDRANRLVQRTVPEVKYGPRSQGIATIGTVKNHTMGPYPWYTNDANGNPLVWNDGNDSLSIAGDVATFAYDSIGNLVTANNADAKIKRAYHPDGRLWIDSLRIRTYAGADDSTHRYGVEYQYDASRRIKNVNHPYQLRLLTGGAGAAYLYDSITGYLSRVSDVNGQSFDFTYNIRGDLIRVNMPGGISDTIGIDANGRMMSSRIRNWATGPHTLPDSLFRKATFAYADPVRLAFMVNLAGLRDTIEARYSGLGQLYQMDYRLPANTYVGNPVRVYSMERFRTDGFGNAYQETDSTNTVTAFGFGAYGYGAYSFTDDAEFSPSGGQPPAGRLRLRYNGSGNRSEGFVYDSAGNTVFSWTGPINPNSEMFLEDRASYYAADNRLRVAEYRRVQRIPSADQQTWPWWQHFEEYRYDALGRRILTRMRKQCHLVVFWSPCELGTIRRTVWDGPRQLYEIQMPGGDSSAVLENDTASVPQQVCFPSGEQCPAYHDFNMQFGRVAYAYAGGVDQPLSIARMKYHDRPTAAIQDTLTWPPFTIVPHWNYRGQAENGTFQHGGWRHCTTSQATRCVKIAWEAKAFAYTQAASVYEFAQGWFGSLRDIRGDGSGLRSMRNRYVDPTTGRFTQEDPIGLAGGSNLYGFADGDPVNFSDPFGLRVIVRNPALRRLLNKLVRESSTFARIFRELHVSKKVTLNIMACSDVGPGCPSRLNLEINKAWIECYSQAVGRCYAYIYDDQTSEEDLIAGLTHEVLHAAVTAGRMASTGATCERGDTIEQCDRRWQARVEAERRLNDEEMRRRPDDEE